MPTPDGQRRASSARASASRGWSALTWNSSSPPRSRRSRPSPRRVGRADRGGGAAGPHGGGVGRGAGRGRVPLPRGRRSDSAVPGRAAVERGPTRAAPRPRSRGRGRVPSASCDCRQGRRRAREERSATTRRGRGARHREGGRAPPDARCAGRRRVPRRGPRHDRARPAEGRAPDGDLAMDQFGGRRRTDPGRGALRRAGASARRRRLGPVAGRAAAERDPLPESWEVTSDSIAAWVAARPAPHGSSC